MSRLRNKLVKSEKKINERLSKYDVSGLEELQEIAPDVFEKSVKDVSRHLNDCRKYINDEKGWEEAEDQDNILSMAFAVGKWAEENTSGWVTTAECIDRVCKDISMVYGDAWSDEDIDNIVTDVIMELQGENIKVN